jgi:uncharacterized protein YoaH (UPF0181 family)
MDSMAYRVAFRYVQKETKQHKVERLAQYLREKTGISSGKASDIADAIVRNRDVEGLAVQKGWPVNEAGRVEGPRGAVSFDEIRRQV